MIRLLILILLSSSITTHAILSAQSGPVKFQDVGVLEEYTNPQVTSLYQDCRGLLWISTYGGIDRWDGKQMVHFPYVPYDSTGSPARDVWCFTGDDQNNIWFLGNGLMKYDLEKEIFRRVPLRFRNEIVHPRYIKYDPRGFLWVGSADEIFQFYPETDSLNKIPILIKDKIEDAYFTRISIIQDSTGQVWMSHNQYGLCWLDQNTGVFITQPMDLPEHVDKHMNVGLMKEDPQGRFWLLGRKAELASFNPYTREFLWADLPVYSSVAPSSWGAMAIDDQGMLWFGTDRGLMHYDPGTKMLTRMDTPGILTYVWDMISDQQGNIIVGTMEGVKVIDPGENAIRTVDVHLEKLIDGVGWHTSVLRDEHYLWLGTFIAGLIRYNLENEEFINFQSDGKSGSINSNYICSILRDRNGRIWFTSGFDGSLYRVNPDNNSFEHFRMGESHYITQGEDGFFWILGRDHMVRFDPVTLNTTRIQLKEALPVEYLDSQQDYVPFIRDDEGIFWFAQADKGMFRIDLEKREWKHYNYDQNNPSGLPDRHIKSLLCDSRGNIWLSTWVGLSRVIRHPDNDTVLTFDNRYILDHRLGHTTTITEDDNGNIFVGTLYGILVIRPDGTVDTYTEKDGLLKDPSNTRMVASDHENGDIYLGGQKVLILHPGFLAHDTSIVPTILTDFRIREKRITPGEASPLKTSILLADRIELDHDQNFFRIDFTAPYLSRPEQNRYRFLLEGIDPDTVYSGNRSYAEYTDLAPGHYTFWVSAASHRGPWEPEGRSIEIIIHPPWYRSKAAISGYFIAMLLLVIGYVRIRTEKLRKEKIVLEKQVAERTAEIHEKNEKIIEMERLKTRFFTDVSHEIRTPLSLISGPLDLLLDQEHPDPKTESHLGMIKRNSQRLLQLMNQLLDISRLDSGQMKLVLENTDVIRQVRVIANEYHSLAERKHICYIIDLPEEEYCIRNDRDKISKITTNLLSNAFKYTPEFGTVTCRAKILSGANAHGSKQLRIIVADTGPGISSENQERIFERFYRVEGEQSEDAGGTGIGLSLTRELVSMLNGEIVLKSMMGKGTVFIVTLPLGTKHLKEKEYLLKDVEVPLPEETYSEHSVSKILVGDNANEKDSRILIVEDNNEVRSFLKENLESTFNILEAEDGLAGLNLAVKDLPDVIISDIMMPGMNGKELCKKLKNDERTSHIPVIMLTARASSHDKIEGLECGADDYIFKPFSMEEVRVRIRNLIEQKERLRKKYSEYIGIDWSRITITTLDEQFLKKVTNTIEEHLHEFNFDVGALKDKMAMSESTLYKKLKALTGESPNGLIRLMRLKKAASLIREGDRNITGILMEVGFSNPSYFTRCFKAYFGVTPKAYQKSNSKP